MNKLISQGAEAKIFLIEATAKKAEQISEKNAEQSILAEGDTTKPRKSAQGGRLSDQRAIDVPHQKILKQRIKKSYRHLQLDNQIRTRRTKSEAKILTRALEAKANVPKVLNLNTKGIPTDKFELKIEYIEGDRLSETLNDYEEKKQFEVMKKLGKQTAILHENDIIHGDLTTSNTILQTKLDNSLQINKARQSAQGGRLSDQKINERSSIKSPSEKVYIIDFGLGFISTKIEDKAVDLHLIKQALETKHFQNWQDLFKNFCKGYEWTDSQKVLERLEVVEKRGRYKH